MMDESAWTELTDYRKTLPWGHDVVLVKWPNGSMELAWFHKDAMGRLACYLPRTTWFTSKKTQQPIYDMSHWMPLPEPPKTVDYA